MAELLVQVSVAVSNSHISGSNFIATSQEFFTPRCSVLEGKWDPLFQGKPGWWHIIIWPDTLSNPQLRFSFSKISPTKREFGENSRPSYIPCPKHIAFKRHIFPNDPNGFVSRKIKHKPPTSTFSNPFPFSNVFYYPWFLLGSPDFLPDIHRRFLRRFSRCKVAKCFTIAGPRSGLQQSDQSLGYSGATVVLVSAVWSWRNQNKSRKGGVTLQGTNISHFGKRKIIFKGDFWWDMWIPRRIFHPYLYRSYMTIIPFIFCKWWRGPPNLNRLWYQVDTDARFSL